jgi:mono/diheme cytochrome c family protein
MVVVALVLAGAGRGVAEPPVVPGANPFEGQAGVVPEGRTLFNQYCGHCHGPNAIQGERPRDLRRLGLRHGERAAEMFWQAVTRGRPDKGMPPWRGTLSDEALWRIFTFLGTVQSAP